MAVRRRTGTTIDASTLHAIEADRQNISGLARHIRLAEQQDIQLQCNITATARQVAHNAEMERQRLESIESNEAIETARKDVSIGRLVYCSQRSLYKLILILFKMLSLCLVFAAILCFYGATRSTSILYCDSKINNISRTLLRILIT